MAQESLKIALTDELPPFLSAFSVFHVAYSGEHAALAWEIARRNVKVLLEKLDSFFRLSYIPRLAGAFSDSARAEELEAFSQANLRPEPDKQVAKAAESIRFKANLKQRELPNIDQWIRSRTQ